MKNADLYALSNSRPLSIDMIESRWRLFGHALRLHIDTPAQRAMKYYFENDDEKKQFRSRPRATVATVLNNDIKTARAEYPELQFHKLETLADL